MVSVYPERSRSAWILRQRPPRAAVPDPDRPRGAFLEEERLADGSVASSGVVLLTNKECPWRCLMCDLWKETTPASVPPGAVPRQVEEAVRSWREAGRLPRQVKLYNSGSFFDPAAIPPPDYPAIAAGVDFAENVVVESHPLLAGRRAAELRDLLPGSLEVAMGLETAHPEILARLNKGFDLEDFARACGFLREEAIAVRVFVLVGLPFLDPEESVDWAVKSADYAFSRGAGAVSLILTRTGNGAMDRLAATGEFVPPKLSALERALRSAQALRQGRVFADTWSLEPFSSCSACLDARRRRLQAINREQRDLPPVSCPACGGT